MKYPLKGKRSAIGRASKRAAAFLALALLLPQLGSAGAILPPVITSHPVSQTVWVGQSVTFQVTVTSSTAVSYQWRKNGANISGATASSYSIASAQLSDQASYSVFVSNLGGSTTSSNATLTVRALSGVDKDLTSTDLAGGNGSVTIKDPPSSLVVSGDLGMKSDGFTFGLSVPLGATYVIEASSNSREWTPIATNIAATATIVFTDPAAGSFPTRFYRALVLGTVNDL